MIAEIASTLSTALGETVYYGMMPDADDGSLDEAVAVIDFGLGSPIQDFGIDTPLFTTIGIECVVRSATSQAAARTKCEHAYYHLLSAGYIAVVPPISLGQDDSGRWLIAAQVKAHEIRS